MPNVVETAASAGSFKTLVAAVQAAGLAEALSGPGPFTVFAPTDEAFAKLPPGAVEDLLRDIPKLQAVLKHHVVSGKMMAADVAEKDSVQTLEGDEISIDTTDGVKVDEAHVVKADIATDNGVIHVIDTVIMPHS
jgi:uncharacterized surface protein with fasciclin (FAS1) repeats